VPSHSGQCDGHSATCLQPAPRLCAVWESHHGRERLPAKPQREMKRGRPTERPRKESAACSEASDEEDRGDEKATKGSAITVTVTGRRTARGAQAGPDKASKQPESRPDLEGAERPSHWPVRWGFGLVELPAGRVNRHRTGVKERPEGPITAPKGGRPTTPSGQWRRGWRLWLASRPCPVEM
jgi:hypothetical protein